VGIENYAGNIGLQWPYQFSLQTPSDNFAIKFYYPSPPLATNIIDATVLSIDNPTTGAIFGVTNGAPYTLQTTVRNYSLDSVNPFNVMGKLTHPSGYSTTENLYTDTLLPAETQTISYLTELQTDTAGTYKFVCTSQLAGDIVNSNNTKKLEIVILDTTLTEMWMGYNGGSNNAGASINWIGGTGGVTNYYIPPFYPIAITKLHYFITSLGYTDAFIARVFDDDGVQSLPFSLLDSVYVAQPNINVGSWTDVILDAPIIINSGGFYIAWDEVGESISLGCSTGDPISNRSFEEFQDVWGIYRYRETQDPMIAATIENYNFPTGFQLPDDKSISISVFPNPAGDEVNVLYNTIDSRQDNSLLITDVHGKQLQTVSLGTGSGTHQRMLNVSSLNPGIYFIILMNGKEKTVKKLVIAE
jgi:hypothetical protein